MHAGTGTAYDQAVDLQNWLRRRVHLLPGRPRQRAGRQRRGRGARLPPERKGYCVHFASAMAVMARTLSIPSRVAVGFLPGTQDEQGTWTVSLRDAHAWPELYFEGVGWVRFEPTPPARTQNVGDVVGGGALQQPTASAGAQPTASASATNGRRKPEDPTPGATAAATAGAQVAGWRRVADALPWPWLAAGGGAGAGRPRADAGRRAEPPATVAGRGEPRRPGRGRAGRAARAARRPGLQVSPAWTPRALRQWLVGASTSSRAGRESLDRIVGALESARYAPARRRRAARRASCVTPWTRSCVLVAEQVPAGPPAARPVGLPPVGCPARSRGRPGQADVAAEQAGRRALDQVDEVRHSWSGGRRR